MKLKHLYSLHYFEDEKNDPESSENEKHNTFQRTDIVNICDNNLTMLPIGLFLNNTENENSSQGILYLRMLEEQLSKQSCFIDIVKEGTEELYCREFSILKDKYFRINYQYQENNFNQFGFERNKSVSSRKITAIMVSIREEQYDRKKNLYAEIGKYLFGEKGYPFSENINNVYCSNTSNFKIFLNSDFGFCFYFKSKEDENNFFEEWFNRIQIFYLFAIYYKIKLEYFFYTLYNKYDNWFFEFNDYDENKKDEIRSFIKEFSKFEMLYFDNIVNVTKSKGEGVDIYNFFAKNLNVIKMHNDFKEKISYIMNEVTSRLLYIESNRLSKELSEENKELSQILSKKAIESARELSKENQDLSKKLSKENQDLSKKLSDESRNLSENLSKEASSLSIVALVIASLSVLLDIWKDFSEYLNVIIKIVSIFLLLLLVFVIIKNKKLICSFFKLKNKS